MGPSKDYAYKVADEFTDKVLADLKTQHQVEEPQTNWGSLKDDHNKAKAQLREAIRELIWNEHCASW